MLNLDAVLTFYLNGFYTNNENIRYCDLLLKETRGNKEFRNIYFNALKSKGYLLVLEQQYEDGVNIINEALESYLSKNDSTGISDCYMYLSEAYLRLELFDQAEEKIELMLQYLPHDFSYKTISINAAVGKGICYLEKYIDDNVAEYGDKAEKIFNDIIAKAATDDDYLEWVSFSYVNLAWKKYVDKDFATAIAYADTALIPYYFEEDPNQAMTKIYADLFKGLGWMHSGAQEKGRKLLNALLEGLTNDNPNKASFRLLSYCTRALFEDALANGNDKEALQYYVKYQAHKDSTAIFKNRGIIFEVNQKYNFQKKQAEISSLKSRHTIDLREKNILLLILIAVIILLFALYKQRQLKQLKAQNAYEEEKRKVEEIIYSQDRKILQEKMNAVAEQRLLISRDMHDGLSSSLAGLGYFVNARKLAATVPHEKDILAEVEAEIRDIYTKARAYMHDLHLSASEIKYDVTGFLQTLSKHFSEGKFYIKTDVDMQEVEALLSVRQQNQLYMILKEAITNTMKYAEASQMTIGIEFIDNTCLFSMTDNGRGFDSIKQEGLGLRSMKHRIASLDGEISIIPLDPGTKIYGSFPLNNQPG